MARPAHDLERVARFLEGRFGGAVALVPLARGEWSQAFAFRSGGRELVLRLGSYVEDYQKDRIATSFSSLSLPVPDMIEVGEALGGAYAISERAFGRDLDGLDAAGYRRALPALFRALDALRDIDTAGTSGYGYWSPGGGGAYPSWRAFLLDVTTDRADARTHGWRERLAAVPAAVGGFEEGYRALQALVGVCPEDRHVVHTDLMAGNVLVDGDRMTAVLDWGNSIYGDALYDLAHLTFWAPWFPELDGIDLRLLAAEHYVRGGLAVPDFDARLRCYELHIGLDAQAYNASTERWDELERSGERTRQVAQGD